MEPAYGPKIISHCPLCHAVYQASEIRLLGEKGPARLFHCTCAACGHAVMAIVLEANGAVSSVGLVTDMEAQDALRFRQALSVSTDDCLAIHELLEKNSRDLCRKLLDKKA
jgi:hypothetical protein